MSTLNTDLEELRTRVSSYSANTDPDQLAALQKDIQGMLNTAQKNITRTAASTVKSVMESKFSVAQTGGDRSPTTPNPRDWTDILAVKTSVLVLARDMNSDPDIPLMMELDTVARMVVLQALAQKLTEYLGAGSGMKAQTSKSSDDETDGLLLLPPPSRR